MVLIILEAQPCRFQFAGAFDIEPVESVYQNVGDAGILEQRLQRAKAENLIQNFPGKPFALGKTERDRLIVDGIADEYEDFFTSRIVLGSPQFLQIKPVQDLAVKIRLDLLVL